MAHAPIESAVARLAQRLADLNLTLATAESCTGGLLAGAITSIAGASNWYEGGFVTYRLSAKQRLLGISADTLRKHGAVSKIVAIQMAQQTLTHCDAQVSIATTGLAGPQGDGTATAVGTLWIAWAMNTTNPHTTNQCWVDAQEFELHLARGAFRETAVAFAIDGLLARLDKI